MLGPSDPAPKDSSARAVQPGLAGEIGSVLGELLGDQCSVEMPNLDQWRAGESRFLHVFTEPGQQSEAPGFLKLAKVDPNDELHIQLQREAAGLSLARHLGIETIECIDPYRETADGKYAAIRLVQLNCDRGETLATAELIAGAPLEYADWAVTALLDFDARREVTGKCPADIDAAVLRTDDKRNESPQIFWEQCWARSERVVDQGLDQLIAEGPAAFHPEARQIIREAMHWMHEEPEVLIREAHDDSRTWFVHDDQSPSNMYFDREAQRAFALDYEHAGLTHNPILAHLTDAGNFFGRMWPNPDMQKRFLSTYLDKTPADELDQAYVFLKMITIFGPVHLAKFAMDAEHPEHDMATAQIQNLPYNLEHLHQEYSQRKEAGGV